MVCRYDCYRKKKVLKNAYLQWKNVKNVNEREPEILCIECPAFINNKNISNTLKFPSAILEDFKVCIKVHPPVLFEFMKCLPAVKCLCSSTS